MTQALYAHMNKRNKKNKRDDDPAWHACKKKKKIYLLQAFYVI
jgi:hypothetical protein